MRTGTCRYQSQHYYQIVNTNPMIWISVFRWGCCFWWEFSAWIETKNITDDIDTCYSNQDDYEAPILNQSIGIIDLDFSVSDGFHKDHQGFVFPMDLSTPILPNDDFTIISPDLIPNAHYSTAFHFKPSESAIDTLLSLGRQGLLETHQNLQLTHFYP